MTTKYSADYDVFETDAERRDRAERAAAAKAARAALDVDGILAQVSPTTPTMLGVGGLVAMGDGETYWVAYANGSDQFWSRPGCQSGTFAPSTASGLRYVGARMSRGDLARKMRMAVG